MHLPLVHVSNGQLLPVAAVEAFGCEPGMLASSRASCIGVAMPAAYID